MIDVLAIPQRLEQAVGKAQRHDVLHRFLAEEMVHPVDLVLLQRLQDLGIERLGRGQIMAERLLDHDPAPLPVFFRHQPRRPQARDDHAEEAIRDREIEKVVACRAGRLVQPRQMLADPAEGRGIGQVTLHIAHAVGQPAPGGLVDMVGLELAILGDEFVHRIGQALAPLLRGAGRHVDADELELPGQPLGIHQIVERRHDQTLRQITGSAEDHHGAGRRRNSALGLRSVPGLGCLCLRGCCLLSLSSSSCFPDVRHVRPSSSSAIATTFSGSNPNLRCSSLSGAEAPKVFMPMTRPSAPT